MNKFNCILFDLDGTLIDTTPLILESFRHTFFHHFKEQVPDDELYGYLGIPLRHPFEAKYPEMTEVLVKTYREYNELKHDGYVSVFIGINEVLEKCRQKGVKLGVVTSKRRELAMRGMELFGLNKYMDVFVGYEDTTIHKPYGEPILKAIRDLELNDKSKVLYVGDSSHDILCAKDAGVRSAAVTGWSYISREELLAASPDFCLETPFELLSYI